MNRRGRCGARRGRGPMLRGDAAIGVLGPAFQFRADAATLSGANVATVPNRMGADSLVMAAGTLPGPAGDALFGGAPSLAFTGTQRMVSNLPASAWKFLHDGTGFEIFEVFAATSAALGVRWATLAGAVNGAQMYSSAGGTVMQVNSGAAPIINATVLAAPVGVGTYNDAYYSETSAPEYAIYSKATLLTSGSSSGAPSAADPFATFTMPAQADGGFMASMKWCETLVFRRVLTSTDRATVRAYIASRYALV